MLDARYWMLDELTQRAPAMNGRGSLNELSYGERGGALPLGGAQGLTEGGTDHE